MRKSSLLVVLWLGSCFAKDASLECTGVDEVSVCNDEKQMVQVTSPTGLSKTADKKLLMNADQRGVWSFELQIPEGADPPTEVSLRGLGCMMTTMQQVSFAQCTKEGDEANKKNSGKHISITHQRDCAADEDCKVLVEAVGAPLLVKHDGVEKGRFEPGDTQTTSIFIWGEISISLILDLRTGELSSTGGPMQAEEAQEEEAPATCTCTGHLNEFTCTNGKSRFCAKDQECTGGGKWKQWSNFCKITCECTGNSNQFKCTNGKVRHCSTGVSCSGKGEWNKWDQICHGR